MTDKDYMKYAIKKAREAINTDQTPFGACIVKDDIPLSLTHNTVWLTGDITAHAEINAIRESCRKLQTINLSDCTLYSTCEPCPMCFSAAHWAKISRIVYGASIQDAQRFGFNELLISNKQMKTIAHCSITLKPSFMKEEAIKLFEQWIKCSSKKVY
ncbi:nucleoside deaminase [Chlamydiota bacterium]